MDTLLDLESSLRTASEPRMPESPAQPLMLADANPVGVPAAPIPLRPDALAQEGGTGVPPVVSAAGAPPVPNIPPMEGGLSSPPLPEGLASKLAQAEGVAGLGRAVAGDLNLAITPATNRLKDKLEEHPQRPAAPKAAAKMGYAPVPRAAKPLPDAAAFLVRLKNPQPPALAPVQVAQAGDAPVQTAPAFDRLYYLAGPGTSPAAADLIAANELLKAGQYQEAFSAVLTVMDTYSHTAPVIDAQTQFDEVFDAMMAKAEAGDNGPLDAFEASIPGGTEELAQRYHSVESRYALIEFLQFRMKQGLKVQDAKTAEAYAARTMDLADRTMRDDRLNPLQSDIMHYYYDTAVFMGGETYVQCITYLQNAVAEGDPSIARWTARLLLAEVYTLTNPNPPERTLQYGSMIDELDASGVLKALEDPGAYTWLQAALESEIAQTYYALGDFDRASEHFKSTFAYRTGKEPKALAMYYLADIAARQNPYDPNEAIALYQDFIERYPQSAHVHAGLLNMAGLYHANGDFKQALQLYQEILERYGDSHSAPVARQEIEYIMANQQGTVEVASTEAPQAANNGELAMHCGPQALQKLLEIQGIPSTVEELATLAGTDETGTAMAGLVRAASAKGLALSGVKTEALADLAAPFVALLDARHFVLVAEVRAQELAVYDAGQPETPMAVSDFAARWKGEALVLAEGVPPLAQLIAPETLEVLRGGGGSSSVPTDKPKGSGSSGGPGQGTTPGTTNGSQASSGFNAPGVNAEINVFESSLDLNETDLSLGVLGGRLSFARSYRSEKGFPRVETASTAKWWENNLGAGWSHNLNLHLRTSSGTTPSTVLYWDTSGTYRTFTLNSTAGGYNIYKRSATGNPDELGDLLKRNTTTKKFTLAMAGGARLEFSAATTSGDYIARVESIVDAMGNTLTFTYDNTNVATGHLTKVQSPAGDAQHLALTYSGNLITKVELKKNTTVLNSVSFAYNGSSELVTVTDHAAKTVQYAYGSDGSAAGSRFITQITNKSAVTADLTWTFGLNSLSQYEAYTIEVDNADALTTVYDRSLTTNVCTISNWDGTTLVNKSIQTPVTGDTSLSRYADNYLDISNYERWSKTYDTARNLTAVTAPGNVASAAYTYNAVGNVLTKSYGTGPVTQYQYDTSGLWVAKTIDAAGIETNYTYGANNRMTKMTHPSLNAAGRQYAYDAYGHVTLETSPLGTQTASTYDSLGRLTTVVQDPGGLAITTSYVYDDLGNMTEMTDPRGKVTTYEYGAPSCGGCGGGSKLIKVTDALSHVTEWIYNANGLLETSIDAAGIETDYAYDTMNRLTSINRPAGSAITSTVTYNKLGQVASRTDFGGDTTSYAYDHMGRAATVTDAVGDIDYAYNSLGQLVTVTDALGHDTTYTYDTAFRLSKVTDAIGKETHYVYDAYGRKYSVGAGTSGTVDPITYTYSGTTGQLTKVEYGSSTYAANYTYDGEGRLTKLTDWIDAVDGLRYAYDAVGRLTTLTDYDDSVLTYTYDVAGNVLSMVDYHGNTTSYTYNDIGQLATLTAPGGKVWTYTYGTGGRLTQVDIPNGMHTEYSYDASGRQDSIHHMDGTTLRQGFDYTFDDGGDITRIDHEDGSFWEYDYDDRDRLITAARGNQTTPTILASYAYTYDAGDNMLTKAVPWYDDFEDGNITGWSGDTGYFSVAGGVMKNTLDAVSFREVYLSETDADQDLSFDYIRYSSTGYAQHLLRFTDSDNRLALDIEPGQVVLRQVDGGTASTLGTYTTTVAEDTWYSVRVMMNGDAVKVYWGEKGGTFNEVLSVTGVTETTTSQAAVFRAQQGSEHGWDNVELVAGTRSTTETFTYNNANEQITHAKNGVTTNMTYDAWGRLTTRDDSTHDATYAYRYGSKLYSLTSDFPDEGNVTYETGGDGKRRNRVAGANETWYNYDMGWNVLSEEDDANGDTGTLTRTNIMLTPGAAVSAFLADVGGATPASGAPRYYVTDRLGSVSGAYGATKAALGTYGYDPFGEEYAFTGDALESLSASFTGKPWDAVSNIYHFPYREYSPVRTRWLTRDPLGMIEGPNVYAYASSSPILRRDLLGDTSSNEDDLSWGNWLVYSLFKVSEDSIIGSRGCHLMGGTNERRQYRCLVQESYKDKTGYNRCYQDCRNWIDSPAPGFWGTLFGAIASDITLGSSSFMSYRLCKDFCREEYTQYRYVYIYYTCTGHGKTNRKNCSKGRA